MQGQWNSQHSLFRHVEPRLFLSLVSPGLRLQVQVRVLVRCYDATAGWCRSGRVSQETVSQPAHRLPRFDTRMVAEIGRGVLGGVEGAVERSREGRRVVVS